MVRYAGDIVILCPSAEAAQGILTTLREWTTEAGLTLHPGKTKNFTKLGLYSLAAAQEEEKSLRKAVNS